MTIFCFNPIEVISGRLNVWVTCGTCQENNDDISFTPVEVIVGSVCGQMFFFFFFKYLSWLPLWYFQTLLVHSILGFHFIFMVNHFWLYQFICLHCSVRSCIFIERHHAYTSPTQQAVHWYWHGLIDIFVFQIYSSQVI